MIMGDRRPGDRRRERIKEGRPETWRQETGKDKGKGDGKGKNVNGRDKDRRQNIGFHHSVSIFFISSFWSPVSLSPASLSPVSVSPVSLLPCF
jgi:hypothetical protein